MLQWQPGLCFVLTAKAGSVRVIYEVMALKNEGSGEKLRLDTMRGQERQLVNVYSQWRPKAQD